MSKPTTPRTLRDAIVYFSDPQRCLDHIVARRWPNGVTCPTCGSTKVHFLANQLRWKCSGKHPKRQFSAKVGTIFEDSPIGFEKWLPAMWLLANCKNGISSYELARDLGVMQRTAWFMLHRIRYAMQSGSIMLGGDGNIVEVDESWIGGKARRMNSARRQKTTLGNEKPGAKKRGSYSYSGKTIVMGMLERGSRVVTRVVPNTRRVTLEPHIHEHVAKGSEIHTDANPSYERLDWGDVNSPIREKRYAHKVVDHAVQYVNGNVHTNSLENFWSLLKRGIRGTYVSVEPFHLFRYLDEQAFRFNERKTTDAARFSEVLGSVAGRRLTYKELTGRQD